MRRGIREYDVIVIGSGSGATIVDAALWRGMRVALVDKGPLGGTCLNVGCIPSKMLTFPADRLMEIQDAGKLGVEAQVQGIDFRAVMERTQRTIRETQESIREGIRNAHGLDFYELEGFFVGDRTMQVGDRRIRGEKVFIASGARPLIPPIEGVEEVDYLTNDNVFWLRERPKSLVIVGGGYVSVEMAHFFAAAGTRVTILQRNRRLVPEEEPEISWLLEQAMRERVKVYTDTEAIAVEKRRGELRVVAREGETGEVREFSGERLLIAAGRRSNADLLQVEAAGIEVDERGYVRVNQYLETNREHVWALGDANGQHMFTHVANREAAVAWHNANSDHKVEMDYGAVPHAVFSYPQIASVGYTEAQAKGTFDYVVGRARYQDVAKGEAMMESHGFAKAIVERESGRIRGFHIIGPYAAMLIQEVVNAMANGGEIGQISRGMHIHPAMPELILATLHNLQEPG